MSKKDYKKETHKKSKSISAVKLVYLILFLIIGGMVILYASGTFASLPVSTSSNIGSTLNQQSPDKDPHAGVDLNALQKIKELEQSIEANFSLTKLLELGHLYNDSGFFQKAIDTYKKYLKENPKSPDVIVDMGVCYFNMQNYDEAKKVMKNALDINPNHQIAKFNLGIVNFSAGDIEEAKTWWRESININPNTEIARKAKSLIESH